MRICALFLMLTVVFSASPVASAGEGCSSAAATVEVQSEDTTNTYYLVSTTIDPDEKAKKDKAEKVVLEIDARIAAEGVNKDGVPYREEVSLHFKLSGVRYGSYSRTVKGAIVGPQVNRHVLGVTIQRVSCSRQDNADSSEDSSVS
ncbi:MAG TPA: hypothetical protein VKG84_05575 [Candidatus Acidoferrales bacterium]|nr:hypothetical protein [Candidatus Acidoferrales bacterium]